MARLSPVFAVLTALVVACSGGGGDEAQRLDVRLGIDQSLSGDGAVYGQSGLEGIELAIKELEADTPGLTIDYTVVDDESTAETGVRAYQTFVDDDVTAIIGPSLSRVGFPALQVAQDAGIPAISPMTTASGIGAIGDYVFRIALAEEAALPPLIQYVSRSTPITTVALFFDVQDAYSVSAALAMRAGVEAVGAEVLLEVEVSGAGSLAEVLGDPRLAQVDVFLLPMLADTAAPVLIGLRQAGLEQAAIGGEALATLDLVRLAGAAADGTYVASTWHADVTGEASGRFVEAYTSAYGHAPENYAALSYATIYVLVDALQRAGSTDATDLRRALAETDGLATVLGSLSMSSQGDAIFQPVFQQFRDGEIVVLQ